MKFKIILLIFFLISIVTYSQTPGCEFDSNRQGMLIYHGDTPGNRFTGYGEAPNNYGAFVSAGNIKYNTLSTGITGITVVEDNNKAMILPNVSSPRLNSVNPEQLGYRF